MGSKVKLVSTTDKFEYTIKEIKEIQKCRDDILYFSRYIKVITETGMANIKLREYQKEILKVYTNNNKILCMMGRQYRKNDYYCYIHTSFYDV